VIRIRRDIWGGSVLIFGGRDGAAAGVSTIRNIAVIWFLLSIAVGVFVAIQLAQDDCTGFGC